MNYEKKYKKALEKARQLCAYPTSKPFVSDLQDLFPELKESENEKIRKELISFLQLPHPQFVGERNQEKWIDWLEKQGEQVLPTTNERAWLYLVDDVLTWKDGIGQYLDDPRVQELAKKLCSKYSQKLYYSTISSNSSNIGNNMQEPADNVEPKFKVVDCV